MEELKEAIFQIWHSITADVTANLVVSMPRRCAAVISAEGGKTKYYHSTNLSTLQFSFSGSLFYVIVR